MSDLLGIGTSALAAYRSALSAVGENVANAHTPGYARRRVVLEELSVSGSADIAYRPQVMFNGVTAAGVARAWDNFKAAEARFSASADGRAAVRQQWLSGVETALDDGFSGVGSAMTGFFTSVASLASDPSLPLLAGTGPKLALLVRAADGRLSLQLQTNGTTVPLPAAGGKLAGLVDVSQTVADRRAGLDALAVDFATMVNDWSAAGEDANGAAGVPLMGISGGAASLQALVTDPDLVPAANPGGAPNGNLIALDAVRSASAVEDRWGALVSANAQMLASANAEAAATARWRDNSYAALDEVTGVDLDAEAADLLRFQQAYSASTRIIQVARETIQALFDAL